MPWFKVDDGFYDHPKVKKLSSHAVRLWLMSGSRSAHYLLDGWVDQAFVNTFANGSRSARALVEANLWYEGHRDGEEGWYFHDWAEYQPMRADVERRRQQTRERVDKHRRNGVTNASGNALCNAGCNAAPDPTRPDPYVVTYGDKGEDLANAHETQRPTSRPPPCPKHPLGYNHDEPCKTCAELRKHEDRKRIAFDEATRNCGRCDNNAMLGLDCGCIIRCDHTGDIPACTKGHTA
jgi:hypothetical protein